MARIRKGGPKRKQGERYNCDKLVPASDKGTTELRLKRDIAAGQRSPEGANLISTAVEKVRRLNSPYPDELKKTVRQLYEAGFLTDEEYSALRDFSRSPGTQTGPDALGILLARNIIDRDEFDHALDFTACWCAVNGKPWPNGWKAERQSPDHGGGFSDEHIKRMKVRYFNCLAAIENNDKLIYPIVRDIVVHGKTLPTIEDVIRFDIVRIGGILIGRKDGTVPPPLRYGLGRLARGIQIIADTPGGDYTKEAAAMIERIRARDDSALSTS